MDSAPPSPRIVQADLRKEAEEPGSAVQAQLEVE